MGGTAFGPGFLWGASTAAYQIEGAAAEGGRGPSIWDRFSHTPGKVLNGDTGDVACDHYHRYPEDVALMTGLGVGAYRFSISWSRLLPEGTGVANQTGLDFYDRLVDAVLAAGIEPWLCLHHWDLPTALFDRGGWTNREAAGWFGDFAGVVARRFGDRVHRWFTFNEPNVMVWLGHVNGNHAPGLRDRQAALSAIHTINLAHGRAVGAIRADAADPKVGLIASLQPVHTAVDDPEHRQAAQTVDLFWNRAMVDPVLLGRYPAALAEMLGDRVQEGDLATIAQPIDAFGLNHYCRMYAVPDRDAPFGVGLGGTPHGHPVTGVGWQIDGSGLYEQLIRLKDEYPPLPIYITENGAAFADPPDADGYVDDQDRVGYLKEYLGAALRARDAGVDLRGYFVWSLLDNFEWDLGYGTRFGIVRVDYDTQVRTPKASYRYMKDVIAASRGG